jgi:hypothetical protein
MAAGPLLAGIVQQSLSYILPDRLRSIQADRIGLLDFDEPQAAATGHRKTWRWISGSRI